MKQAKYQVVAVLLFPVISIYMKGFLMIKALVFDFDGLILDTEISALQSWQEVYQVYKHDLPLEK